MTYIIFHLSFSKFLGLIGWRLSAVPDHWPARCPDAASPDKCYLDSITEGQCTGELPGNQRAFKMQNMSLSNNWSR